MEFIIDKIIWGWPLIITLLVISGYLTFRMKFVQLRYLKLMPKLLLEKNEEKKKISSFQTITLILANHIGTGNIIGVSAAIMFGGPGAVFWMWVTALLCSALSFTENTLGQMYKTDIGGEYRGGPAYYILKGVGSKPWAYAISFTFLICLGLFMPAIQSAAISSTMNSTFNFPKAAVGIVVTLSVAFIIFGNSKRIVHASEIIVPFMAGFYLVTAIVIIFFNVTKIDDVFFLIINSAINSKSFYGAVMGTAISFGLRRGLFSNEAGIGSSPNISASSNVSHPVKQGLISAFCVYIDTILICSATAFMVLITDSYNVIQNGNLIYEGLKGKGYAEFVSSAVDTVFTGWGGLIITIAIFFFAYTSIFGGFYNAGSNLIFLFKNKTYKIANFIYKFMFLTIIFMSSIFEMDLAWRLVDFGIGIAALVNIAVILSLNSKVVEVLHDFELKYKRKDHSRYVNRELECWRDFKE